jgi:hypothetical protein
MKLKNFHNLLKTELEKPLPGTEVQWQMASSDRMVRSFPRVPGKDARIAAVLILLYPDKGSIHTVLMQRHDYAGVHGGQISLIVKSPGNTIPDHPDIHGIKRYHAIVVTH